MSEENRDQLVEQLIDTVTSMTQTLKRVMSQHEFHRDELNAYKEEIKRIRDRVSSIVRVVHEGNGERALVTRVAVLEEKVIDLEKDVDRLFEKHRLLDARKAEETKVSTAGRWQLRVALVSAVAAIIVAGISLLSKLYQ